MQAICSVNPCSVVFSLYNARLFVVVIIIELVQSESGLLSNENILALVRWLPSGKMNKKVGAFTSGQALNATRPVQRGRQRWQRNMKYRGNKEPACCRPNVRKIPRTISEVKQLIWMNGAKPNRLPVASTYCPQSGTDQSRYFCPELNFGTAAPLGASCQIKLKVKMDSIRLHN